MDLLLFRTPLAFFEIGMIYRMIGILLARNGSEHVGMSSYAYISTFLISSKKWYLQIKNFYIR